MSVGSVIISAVPVLTSKRAVAAGDPRFAKEARRLGLRDGECCWCTYGQPYQIERERTGVFHFHRVATGRVQPHIDKLELFNRDQWRCGICGLAIDRFLSWPDLGSASVDHITPVATGGDVWDESNLQAAHLGCNIRKSDGRIPGPGHQRVPRQH